MAVEREVAERRWTAMGTECHVVVVLEPGRPDPLDAAVGLVEHLEQRWSRFRVDSDITRVNDAAGTPVAVSPVTLDAVHRALAARESTAGRFDPTVERALVAAGYDRPFQAISGAARTEPQPCGARVDVDRRAGTVAVERAAGLDLGGIGKGLAADRVVDTLLAVPGVLGALASIGGDVRCTGEAPPPHPDAWGVAVDDHDGATVLLAVGAGAVATSTTRRRRWTTAHGDAHHVIDPGTGLPAATAVQTATALAATAADAEVAATVALLDGPGATDVPWLVTTHDGLTLASPDLEPFLR